MGARLLTPAPFVPFGVRSCRHPDALSRIKLDHYDDTTSIRPEQGNDTVHLRSKIRLSGSVALFSTWLASMSLSACRDTVLVGQSCAASCEEANPRGLELYRSVSGTCVCSGCSAACDKSICEEDQTPSDACLPCVQAALGDACIHHSGLFGTGCSGHPECQAFVDCLMACPNE